MQLANACDTGTAALRSLLETEYAFGQQARTAVRAAGSLERYPAGADMADSGDLGFTTGPWIYSAAGAQIHGHFLTIWKSDAICRWRVEFDGGVAHAAPANVEPKLVPEAASYVKRNAPLPKFIAEDLVSRAILDFQDTSRQDGFPAALRTYARTADFRLYTDGEAPLGVAAANRYLIAHTVVGAWKEDAGGRSADSTLAYSVGELSDAHQRSSHAYVEIWQYDPRVANWGLRVLLINPLAPPKKKP